MNQPEGCNHSAQSWWRDQDGTMCCADCEDEAKADPNKVYYKGKIVKLGGMPSDYGQGRNPRCCTKARTGNFYFCVCMCRSYCPDHGVQCNGSHD